VAIGTVSDAVPLTGLAPNFSPMPRMAPPPWGRATDGAAGCRSPSAEGGASPLSAMWHQRDDRGHRFRAARLVSAGGVARTDPRLAVTTPTRRPPGRRYTNAFERAHGARLAAPARGSTRVCGLHR